MANPSFYYLRLWRIYYVLYYFSENSAVSSTKNPMLDCDVKPSTYTTVHLYMCTYTALDRTQSNIVTTHRITVAVETSEEETK
jgi:hypothetical protein